MEVDPSVAAAPAAPPGGGGPPVAGGGWPQPPSARLEGEFFPPLLRDILKQWPLIHNMNKRFLHKCSHA